MDVVKSITDLFGNVVDAFKERVASPIVGTFIFSWLLINWKLVYFLLGSDESTSSKISHIELHYLDFYHNLLYPILITALYLVLYPLIVNSSNTVWILVDSKSKSIFSKYTETNVPISEEAQEKLFNHLRQQENTFKIELQEKQKQIKALNEALNSQTSKVNELEKKLGEYSLSEQDPTAENSVNLESNANSRSPKPSYPPPAPVVNDNGLSKDTLDKLNTTEGDYRLEYLIANNLDLDRDDNLHKKEIKIAKEIVLKLIKSYPEPWPVREFTAIAPDGRSNMQYSKDVIESFGKKLIKRGWFSPTEYGGVKSYSMSTDLITEINSIDVDKS